MIHFEWFALYDRLQFILVFIQRVIGLLKSTRIIVRTPLRNFLQCFEIFRFLAKRSLTLVFYSNYSLLNFSLDEISHRLCTPEHLLGGREGQTGHQERSRWLRQTQLPKTEFGHVPVLQKLFESNHRELLFFATGECRSTYWCHIIIVQLRLISY